MSSKSAADKLEKALIGPDALVVHGEIDPMSSDKFLEYVVDETSLKSNCRIIKIAKGHKWEANTIDIGERVTVPKRDGVDPGTRSGVSTGLIELATSEVMSAFDISDGFLEDNIEGTSIKDKLMRMFAIRLGTDIEETVLLADKLGPAAVEEDIRKGGDPVRVVKDELHSMFDGYLRLADSGIVYDAENTNFSVPVARQALTSLPTKYRRKRGDLRLMMPTDLLEIWREAQAKRLTALGDQATGGGAGVKPFGLIPADMALLPFRPKVVEHVTLPPGTEVPLRYGPISNVIVTPVNLGKTPIDRKIIATDYTVNLTTGTIESAGPLDGLTVKVTYNTQPQLVLTAKNNLIWGISRDIRVEKDRNIHRGVWEVVITTKVGVAIENPAALVKVINLGEGVSY